MQWKSSKLNTEVSLFFKKKKKKKTKTKKKTKKNKEAVPNVGNG